MQIAYKWLLDYLPRPIPIDELSNILTSIGLEVEGIEKSESIPGSLEGLIIGHVETCLPHPNADKLKLTTVSVGKGQLLSIVCGAPNVAAGQKVVVAQVGTTVYPTDGAPFLIKKSKIRGEVSEGMICAEDEIGLGKSHDGILILPQEVETGTLASSYFNIPESDYTIHIGLTPNRSDANSHIGVARDVCTYMVHHDQKNASHWRVQYPDTSALTFPEDSQLPVSITLTDLSLCPRYVGLSIVGVTVGPSPVWLTGRLKAIGIRSINNIVDITNYVLHEYGQPLHTYDYDKIAGQHIIVKHAEEGSKFIGLDEKERTLRFDDLMIADDQKDLSIAGVLGGLSSGVETTTQNIFLESAYFFPRGIRRTSMHHGLRTDAATHFEKGVDMEMLIPALTHAAQLIVAIAGGTFTSPIVDFFPTWLPPQIIAVPYRYIEQICGKTYSAASIDRILEAGGFKLLKKTDDYVEVKVPSNKPDIKQPADIAEEILRIDGLDNVPIPTRLNISLHRRPAPKTRKWKEKIANYLTNAGLQEIVTNSITNSKYYDAQVPVVKMINSLSSELNIMRPSLLESGLEVVAYNANRKQQDLKLYESGSIYHQSAIGQYQQTDMIAIWISGNIKEQHWQHGAEKAEIYYIKGLLQNLFTLCGIKKVQEVETEGTVEWKRGKQTIARAFTVSADRKKLFDIKQEVFYAEIDVQEFVNAAEGVKVKYNELPKYPAMRRDLALVLDKNIPYSSVAAIAQSKKWDALKNFELFDIFESDKIGADKKSLALSFDFQLNDRTLTDEEVDGMMKELIAIFQKDLHALIRE